MLHIILMKSLIVQFADRHAECIGIVVEYLLKDTLDSIDIFLGGKDENTDQWFQFFKRNYTGIIELNRITIFPQSSYQYHRVIFLTSTDYFMIDKLNPIIKLINYRNMGALVHQYSSGVFRDNFVNLSITPLIPLVQVPMNFRYYRSRHKYNDSFIPSVQFFMTGWGEHVNFKTINDELKKSNIKCLFISKRESDSTISGYSNIIFCKNVSTDDLIRCFIFKICIFYPNPDSVYVTERISGCIHLAASFDTKIYMPSEIKAQYMIFKNFCGY